MQNPEARMTTTHSALIPRHNRFLRALAAATITVATPLALAQSNALPPSTPSGKPLAFSIVSVKPHGNVPGGMEGCNVDRCHFVDRPLRAIIMTAYNNLTLLHIFGGPSWMLEDRFDLDAKIDPADMPATPLASGQLAEMLQPVLADRFQLRVHHEMRTRPVYNIVLAKGGLKMNESASPAPAAPGNTTSPAGASPRSCYNTSVGNGVRVMHNCAMNGLTTILEGPTGRVVVDKTGLTGHYDFELRWTPDNTPPDSPLAGGPSIFTAVQEQLGLKLEPSNVPVDVVVDSAQKPTPN
jgi:uncharacterized protein (TIGR03435 family)